MKVKFRAAQVTLFLGILLPVVGILGFTALFAVRFTAQDLANQLMDQTSSRIDLEIQRIVQQAMIQVQLDKQLIESGDMESDDFAELVRYWEHVLDTQPELSSMFIGVERNGESVGVSRHADGFRVWQLDQEQPQGPLNLKEFRIREFPNKPFHTEPNTDFTVLDRPWYQIAKKLGHGAWTESYPFLGGRDTPPAMGVTYSEPIFKPDRSLAAVVSVDISLERLCTFLKKLHISDTGYAFVIELREDGTRTVLAHPDGQPYQRDAEGHVDPLPVEKSSDPLVKASLQAIEGRKVDSSDGLTMRFKENGVRYLGVIREIAGGDHSPRWQVCIVLPEAELLEGVYTIVYTAGLVILASILVVILASLYLSSQVARPLERLSYEAEAIGRFDLTPRPLPNSIVKEIDQLAVATDEMKTGLRSFQKFVPPGMVRGLLKSRQEAIFGGERRLVTIFFSDIVNFTTAAEGLEPEQLVLHLRDYLTLICDCVSFEEGTVDKFIGDSVMAFWGAPEESPEGALAACRAALNAQARLKEASREWAKTGRPEFRTRIGIHTGEVIVGNIGSDTRLSYTVIGDAVNLASRLEGLNKEYGTHLMISEATRQAAGGEIVARPLDWASVKGKSIAVGIYELLGLTGETPADLVELAALSQTALERYRGRDWVQAIAQCDAILSRWPDDTASLRLRERCRQFQEAPPPTDWDGTFHATSK